MHPHVVGDNQYTIKDTHLRNFQSNNRDTHGFGHHPLAWGAVLV